ncbi:MAG: hypothetical protein KGH90_00535 [Xanthomonadaceae bacterium]|nr:hypothetical protein [Xanthomonadaceae bacterium]
MSQELVEESRRYDSYPLLLLPSTPAAFSMIALCSQAGLPVKVVGHALWMKEWAPALVEHVHSPLGIWRIVKDSSTLPFAVVSFQDQLANVDDSFHTVIVEDQQVRVSPIEAMLMMRFHPRTYVATATEGRPGKPSSLTLAVHAADLSDHMSTLAFDAALGELLLPLLKCHRHPIGDWHARDVFAMKVGRNFERMLSLRLQEIESLIRVYQDRHGTPSSLAPSLERLRKSRQELVRHIH